MKKHLFRMGIALALSLLLATTVPISQPGLVFAYGNENIEEKIRGDFSEMEDYVCYLINERDDVEFIATIDTWRENLQYLSENEEVLRNIPDVKREFIDAYISEFRYVDEINAILLSGSSFRLNDAEPTRSLSPAIQAREDTAAYANTYYSSYNTSNYPTWPLDCANFASQCLHAGGKPMVGTPSTAAVANNINNWFSYGTTQSAINVSESWRAANGFCLHWMYSAVGYAQFTTTQMASYGAAYSYGGIGDAVSLLAQDSQGYYYAYHTMIVVGKSNGNLILAAHTNNTNSTTLASKASSCAGCIIFNIFGYD